MKPSALLLTLFVIFTFASGVLGQGQSGQESLTFEVASVKPNKSGSLVTNQTITNGRYTATNLSVIDLLAISYMPTRSRIIGGPRWIAADRFDILAKADGQPSDEQVFGMIRSLLADRFKLVVHRETRDIDVYDLVAARSDGRLGTGLRRSTAKCVPVDAPRQIEATPTTPRCSFGMYPGRVAATAVTLPFLSRLLMPWLDQREVRDRTGLDGRFDVTLTFTPDRSLRIPPNAPDDLRRAIEAIDPSGPSLLTAVQEQLGLKLEPTKAPVDVIVVDHIEQPTPD